MTQETRRRKVDGRSKKKRKGLGSSTNYLEKSAKTSTNIDRQWPETTILKCQNLRPIKFWDNTSIDNYPKNDNIVFFCKERRLSLLDHKRKSFISIKTVHVL